MECQLQHHQSQYQEPKKMRKEMAQLYARVRESEQNFQKLKDENEELHQRDI